jgi:hypothetical protein
MSVRAKRICTYRFWRIIKGILNQILYKSVKDTSSYDVLSGFGHAGGKMEMVVFEALRKGDWSTRLSALVAIQEAMKNESKGENLWSLQQAFDSQFHEDAQEGVIFTLEILVLRERFCQIIHNFPKHKDLWEPVLFSYIHDRLPDTHPQPDPSRSGPEWSAPSKWKIRIEAAHSLGILCDSSALPQLQMLSLTESVPLVRRAMGLAAVALELGHQQHLKDYLEAYVTCDREKGKEYLEALFSGAGTTSLMYRDEILSEIGV